MKGVIARLKDVAIYGVIVRLKDVAIHANGLCHHGLPRPDGLAVTKSGGSRCMQPPRHCAAHYLVIVRPKAVAIYGVIARPKAVAIHGGVPYTWIAALLPVLSLSKGCLLYTSDAADE